jgi:Fe-S-cluster containining protein
MSKTHQNTCLRCGACCLEGGPALHSQDLEILRSGRIPLNHLVTIRKGELVHNPKSGKVQAVRNELVKIGGKSGDWRCRYFEEKGKGCGIYQHRPQACAVLKCWDPGEILQLVEQDVLSRLDILADDHPLRSVIIEHERICPCPDLEGMAGSLADLDLDVRAEIETLVGRDLHFRTKVVKEHGLGLAEELFFFGRPLFQLLQQLGVRISETPSGLSLLWPR